MVIAILVLGGIALLAAVVLYVCSRKFAVHEDPRLAEVAAVLPQANCGGCGFAGCAGLAAAIVKGADIGSVDGLSCPVGGDDVMKQIARLLDIAPTASEPRIATVMCNGSCDRRINTVYYDGLHTCYTMNATAMGESPCGYGCLGCGDCASACQFGGIRINPHTRLPEVDATLCTACGSCVAACPRGVIELRPRGKKDRRVYVCCNNKDKGAASTKACSVSCIGCGKCAKECPFNAIAIQDNLAVINPAKCRLCRKCEATCPRNAIVAVNFPEKTRKEAEA